jgi:hypothetical protein
LPTWRCKTLPHLRCACFTLDASGFPLARDDIKYNSLESHRLAINPATRTGFVLNGQEFAQTELQSFSY